MKLFDKRPLCMILSILLGGFVFFADAPLYFEIPVISLALIALICLCFVNKERFIYKTLAIISSASILFSSLLSFLYYNCYFNVYNHYTQDVSITATVNSVKSGEYTTYLELKTEKINDKGATYTLSSNVSPSISHSIQQGDLIVINGKITDFNASNNYDNRAYMRARGFSGELTDVTSVKILENGKDGAFEFISDYRDALSDWIIKNSGNDGGGLLSALILGDKSHLPYQARLNFTRTGLSHLLALSGLHLSIIVFGISSLLSIFKIKKKIRKVVEIVFVVLYVILTGIPISVLRAGLMVIISSVLFLFAARSDSITTLSISVLLICLAMPYSIYDISLWLSVFATLGVLIYSELTDEYKPKDKNVVNNTLRNIISGICISLFAIGATSIFTCLSFKTASLLGAFVTPIISVLTTPFMYLGIIFMLVGNIFGLGYLIDAFGSLILNTVKAFSSISGVYLVAENVLIQILTVVFTILFCLFIVLDVKKKKAAIITLLSMLTSIYVSAIGFNIYHTTSSDVEYIMADNNEYILIKSKMKTAMIDVSGQSTTDTYDAINIINGAGFKEIDSYVYTNYTYQLEASALNLSNNIYVKNLYIPEPATREEEAQYSLIEDVLKGSMTALHTYSAKDFIYVGSYAMIFPYRSLRYDKNAFLIFDEKNRVTSYMSSGMLNDDTKSVAVTLINGCDTLILGRHGTSYSDYKFIIEFNGIERILLSSKNLTIPSEVLKHYSETAIFENVERMSIKH